MEKHCQMPFNYIEVSFSQSFSSRVTQENYSNPSVYFRKLQKINISIFIFSQEEGVIQ